MKAVMQVVHRLLNAPYTNTADDFVMLFLSMLPLLHCKRSTEHEGSIDYCSAFLIVLNAQEPQICAPGPLKLQIRRFKTDVCALKPQNCRCQFRNQHNRQRDPN